MSGEGNPWILLAWSEATGTSPQQLAVAFIFVTRGGSVHGMRRWCHSPLFSKDIRLRDRVRRLSGPVPFIFGVSGIYVPLHSIRFVRSSEHVGSVPQRDYMQ